MFGRPVESPSSLRGASRAGGVDRQRLDSLWQKPVPPGLVPFELPALLVLGIAVVVVLPGAAALAVVLVVLVGVLAAAGLRRYRFIQEHDGYHRPRNEELVRSFIDLRGQQDRKRDRDRRSN
jgi:hypothetical protein